MILLTLLALGAVNWLGTMLIVESEFFRSLREFVEQRYQKSKRKLPSWFWFKVSYMINCQLCAGVWVGLALVPFAPALFGAGVLPLILTGLLIKAIGHAILVWQTLQERRDRGA